MVLSGVFLFLAGGDHGSCEGLAIVTIFAAAGTYLGCFISSAYALSLLSDTLPLSFFLLDDSDRTYTKGVAAYSFSRRTQGNALRGPRAVYANQQLPSDCLDEFLNSRGLAIPSILMVSPRAPLSKPFLLGKDPKTPPDASGCFEYGESDDYGPGNDPYQWRSDFLWETEYRYVSDDIKWEVKDAFKEEDVCEIEINSASGGAGWDESRIESFICRAFDACKAEREQISLEMGETLGQLESSSGSSAAQWVLPEGWDNLQEVREYYRRATASERDRFLASDRWCVWAFNMCFLVFGGVAIVLGIVGLIWIVLDDSLLRK
jgi:hypothetical protein